MPLRLLISTIALAMLLFVNTGYSQDGYMVHEKASASSSITYSQRGFSIKGKPTYIYAGEIHYPRIPRVLWKERLMKMKRAGYNTVSSYAFWSFHEPVQGQFHFEDNLDVDAWLSLVDSLGMYAIMRVGPYICAETDFGGFPCWLADIAGMKYRVSTGPFMGCVDKYWEKLFPILIKHQIHKGGCLINVQLENEYYHVDAVYQQHLIDKAVSLGLEIPYTWSKCINGNKVWTNLTGNPFANPNTFPWFATEFWTGWFNENGEPTATEKYNAEYGTWKFVSFGTGGICHYMINGGTNFGYSASDDNQNTSYDYHAPIGECGQFRSQYWTLKQIGLFTRSFESILATSTDGASQITLSPATGLYANVHTSTVGTIAIVNNTTTSPIAMNVTWKAKNIKVPTTGTWTIAPDQFCHFLSDVPLTANTTIDYSATGVMTIKKIAAKNYVVLYGTKATNGEIAFSYKTIPTTPPTAPWKWDAAAKRASISFTYPPDDSISEATVTDGTNESINLLIMSTNQALNHTWIDSTTIVSGPDYLDENNKLLFPAAGGRAFVFSGIGKTLITKAASLAPVEKAFSTGWKWLASPEVATAYDDSKWQSQTGHIDMAAFGWPNGYGWYRYVYTAAQASTAAFTFYGVAPQDTFRLFVNGKFSGPQMQLQQGDNTIAILTGDYSRSKEFGNYSDPLDVDRSGILWGFSLNAVAVASDKIKFRGGFDGFVETPMTGNIPDTSWGSLMNKTWNTTAATADNIPKLWRIDFDFTPPDNGYQSWVLNETVTKAGRGVVWLNGHNIGRNLENQFPLFVPHTWLKTGANTMLIFTEDGKAPQNCKLTPTAGEYRSYASLSTGAASPENLTRSLSAARLPNHVEYKVVGNRFTVPQDFLAKQTTYSVFDITGRMIRSGIINNKSIDFGEQNKVSKGVYIVRLKALSPKQ